MNHQVNIAEILVSLYNPIQGSEGAVTRRQKTPVRSMKAVEEYERTLDEARELVLPELVSSNNNGDGFPTNVDLFNLIVP